MMTAMIIIHGTTETEKNVPHIGTCITHINEMDHKVYYDNRNDFLEMKRIDDCDMFLRSMILFQVEESTKIGN